MKGNKSKNIKVIACIISLISIMSVTGIFSYLTDSDFKYDKFTVGQVRIEVEEPAWENAVDLNNNNIPDYAENIVPNSVIKKDPQIVNVGENSALVYFKVKVPVQNIITANDDGTLKNFGKPENTGLFTYSINDQWKEIASARDIVYNNDGKPEYFTYIYYYNSPLKNKNERTQSLFDEVKFVNLINNEPDFDLYQIVIEAYAIQADNLPLDSSIEDAYTIYLNQNK